MLFRPLLIIGLLATLNGCSTTGKIHALTAPHQSMSCHELDSEYKKLEARQTKLSQRIGILTTDNELDMPATLFFNVIVNLIVHSLIDTPIVTIESRHKNDSEIKTLVTRVKEGRTIIKSIE